MDSNSNNQMVKVNAGTFKTWMLGLDMDRTLTDSAADRWARSLYDICPGDH